MNASLATAALAFVAIAVPTSASAAAAHRTASFRVGAASVSYTPPRAGQLANDPANCDHTGQFNGPRKFAFEEPYKDLQGSGHFDSGDPYVDCNGNGRWDGNLLGGGPDSPRFYDHVADKVGARAMVVSNGKRTIAVEVLDNEGAFNVYLQRIRRQVARRRGQPRWHLHQLQPRRVGAGHDRHLRRQRGDLERQRLLREVHGPAVREGDRGRGGEAAKRHDPLRGGEGAIEPAPVLVVVSLRRRSADAEPAGGRHDGRVIATLATSASTLSRSGSTRTRRRSGGSPPTGSTSSERAPAALRRRRDRDGRVGRQRRDAEVFSGADLADAQQFIDESHPGGLPNALRPERTPAPVGYDQETKALGQSLAAPSATRSSRRAGRRDRSDLGQALRHLRPAHQHPLRARRAARRVRGPARLHRQLHRRSSRSRPTAAPPATR